MPKISITQASSLRSITFLPPTLPSVQKGERFGDFTIRAGFVAASGKGASFHANTGQAARAYERVPYTA